MSSKKIKKNVKNISIIWQRFILMCEKIGINECKLRKSLKIKPSYLTDIKYGRSKGGLIFWESVRKYYPLWHEYLRGNVNHPPQDLKSDPESMIEEEGCLLHQSTPEYMASGDKKHSNIDISKHSIIQDIDSYNHEDIINMFEDKKWVMEINKKLLALERIAPDKKEYIKGILTGLLENYISESKKNEFLQSKIGSYS